MTLLELAYKLRPYIEKAAQFLDDKDALEAPSLYPKWQEGMAYTAGFRVRYGDTLYSVLSEHTSQSDWTPDVAPSLYAKVHPRSHRHSRMGTAGKHERLYDRG